MTSMMENEIYRVGKENNEEAHETGRTNCRRDGARFDCHVDRDHKLFAMWTSVSKFNVNKDEVRGNEGGDSCSNTPQQRSRLKNDVLCDAKKMKPVSSKIK